MQLTRGGAQACSSSSTLAAAAERGRPAQMRGHDEGRPAARRLAGPPDCARTRREAMRYAMTRVWSVHVHPLYMFKYSIIYSVNLIVLLVALLFCFCLYPLLLFSLLSSKLRPGVLKHFDISPNVACLHFRMTMRSLRHCGERLLQLAATGTCCTTATHEYAGTTAGAPVARLTAMNTGRCTLRRWSMSLLLCYPPLS